MPDAADVDAEDLWTMGPSPFRAAPMCLAYEELAGVADKLAVSTVWKWTPQMGSTILTTFVFDVLGQRASEECCMGFMLP